MNASGGGDWEDSRAEFFQESYPSADRASVSADSVNGASGGLGSLPSTVGRRINASGTSGSRSSARRGLSSSMERARVAGSVGSVTRVSTLESRRSTGAGTTIPIASSIDEVGENDDNDYTDTRHLVEEEENALPALPSRYRPPSTVTAVSNNTAGATTTSLLRNGGGVGGNNSRAGSVASTAAAMPLATSTKAGAKHHHTRMRAAVQGLEEADDSDQEDIEVLNFNDENLATEMEVWRDMKKLKHLPTPLCQKKTLRLQYQKCPKIKLQKRVAVKFCLTQFWSSTKDFCSSVNWFLATIFRPLLTIETHRGSEMYQSMVIHKLTLMLSYIVACHVILFLVLPYLFLVCNLFAVDYSVPSCDLLLNGTRREDNFLEATFHALQAYRKPPMTFISIPRYYQLPLMYGSYEAVFLQQQSEEVEKDTLQNASDVIQTFYQTRMSVIYACTVLSCLLGLALYFFRQLIGLIRGVISEQTSDSWFKNVFASWNFSNVCPSYLKHKSLYNHTKQRLRFKKECPQPSCGSICLLGTGRILAVLFTVILWVVAVATMHFAIVFKPRDILQLMIQSTGQQLTDDLEILTGRCLVFLPAVLTVIVKLASPPFARLLGRMESYPFTLRVTLYSARMFSFRIVTVLTLVTTMFHLKNNSGNKATGSNNHTDCWEDNLCLHLILIATLDFIADMLMTTVFRFFRVIIQKLCRKATGCKLDFDPYETLVDLVMDLSLITCGMLYCPVIPIVVSVKLMLSYGLRMFHIWVNCSTSRQIHSASYIKTLYVGLTNVVIVFSAVCHVFAIAFLDVSHTCGPFQGMGRIWNVFDAASDHLPQFAPSGDAEEYSFSYISLIYILVSTICVLVFGLYISHLKRLSIEKNANELKCQLAITTQEKCYLISKIKRPPSSKTKQSNSQ